MNSLGPSGRTVGGPNLWATLREFGIPWITVGPNEPKLPITFTESPQYSDPGPYPIPRNAPIETGEDHHVVALQTGTCKVYELYNASPTGAGWNAGTGAVFDLNTGAYRPEGWVSADAVGNSIFASLLRFEDIQAGRLNHAIRMTATRMFHGYVPPARYPAGFSNDPSDPPAGTRFRLKAGYDISNLDGQARIIAEGLKRYGAIISDHGPNWMIIGDRNPGWDFNDINRLTFIPSTAFEAVYTGEIRACPDQPC